MLIHVRSGFRSLRNYAGAAMAAMILSSGSGFAQVEDIDTARVPVVVNVDAVVTIAPPAGGIGVGQTLNAAAGTETEFILLLNKENGGVSVSHKPQKPTSVAVSVTYSRGNVALKLNARQYKDAEISLHSVNGRQIMHGRVSASNGAFSISRPNTAKGVYVLSVKGTNGNSYATRLIHNGGRLNINAAFAGENLSLGKQAVAAADYGVWTITASASGYKDTSYQFSPIKGINQSQSITLSQGAVDPGTVVRGTFSDSRDGKVYKYVTIGNQTWMAENLNYEIGGRSWCYGNNPDSCAKYGRLYNRDVALALPTGPNPNPGACPSSWHLPTSAEWDELLKHIDNGNGGSGEDVEKCVDIGPCSAANPSYVYYYESHTAGKHLKSISGWGDNDGNGLDTYGFSALPGGRATNTDNSNRISFGSAGHSGYWWSVERLGNWIIAFSRSMGTDWNVFEGRLHWKVGWTGDDYSYGWSVRCVRDVVMPPTTTYSLTTNANPSTGGTVSPAGKSTYSAGTPATVTATAAAGYMFTGWSGASTSTNGQVTITMDGNKTLTANFIPVYLVTVTGGTGGGSFAEGAAVAITATPPVGHEIVNWTSTSNGVVFADAGSAATTFTMPANAVTVTAVFRKLETLVDERDNTVYKVVTIGNQVWMAENLNYDTADGTSSWCYRDDTKYCDIYGRLYDWETAMTVCPSGWHLPSRAEWQTLVDYVGGYEKAGTKLKSQTGWYDGYNDYIPGTDNYGFSALPGGLRSNSVSRLFTNEGYLGYWWSGSDTTGSNITMACTGSGVEGIGIGSGNKTNGYSVRCVKNN